MGLRCELETRISKIARDPKSKTLNVGSEVF